MMTALHAAGITFVAYAVYSEFGWLPIIDLVYGPNDLVSHRYIAAYPCEEEAMTVACADAAGLATMAAQADAKY